MNLFRLVCCGLAAIVVAGMLATNSAQAQGTNILKGRNVVAQPIGLQTLRLGSAGGWLGGLPDPDPDENEPDKSAWQVFIAINALAPSQQQVGPSNVTTNNAIWETWADDSLTFPSSPNLSSPPQWPSTATTFPLKRLRLPLQNVIRRLLMEKKSPALAKQLLTQLQIAHPEIKTSQLFTINPKNPPRALPRRF